MKTNLPQKISRKRKGIAALEVVMIIAVFALLIGGIYAFMQNAGNDAGSNYKTNVGDKGTINIDVSGNSSNNNNNADGGDNTNTDVDTDIL